MIAWDLRSAREHPSLDAGEPPEGFLSAPERAFFARLKTPRRRREWLLGRWAAKALVGAWLQEGGRRVEPSAMTISPDLDGAPFAVLGRDGRLPITLSLSHRDDLALCVLVDEPTAPLGADLELCEPRSAGFVSDFFTAGEIEAISAAPDRDRAITELWALKESALKAVRLGLRADTRRVEARTRSRIAEGGWGPATVALSLEGLPPSGQGLVRDEGRYVVCVVWLGEQAMAAPSDHLRCRTFLPQALPVRVSLDGSHERGSAGQGVVRSRIVNSGVAAGGGFEP